MTAEREWPQKGDSAVDLRTNGRAGGPPDRVSADLTVERVTATLVITSDGERYNRERLHPVSEGRYSDRELTRPTDPRVLAIRARLLLAGVAQRAERLNALEHKDAVEVMGALATIIREADRARQEVATLLADASAVERASK
jgi:hypothetical protein